MDIHRLLNTPPRRRLPSEILETPPPLPLSQLSTQSWDSQTGPRPSPSYELIIPSQSDLNTPSRRRQPSQIPLSQLSTQSWDSQNGPRPSPSLTLSPSPSPSPSPPLPHTPTKSNAPLTTRSDRIRIKTALDFGHKPQEIQSKYHYTLRQIQWAKEHRNTPQKHRTGRHKPKINTPTRHRLEQWLL